MPLTNGSDIKKYFRWSTEVTSGTSALSCINRREFLRAAVQRYTHLELSLLARPATVEPI